MLIGQIYFKGDTVVLRDVDGSEVELSLGDAINLFIWLRHNMDEIERRNMQEQFEKSNPDDFLHEG